MIGDLTDNAYHREVALRRRRIYWIAITGCVIGVLGIGWPRAGVATIDFLRRQPEAHRLRYVENGTVRTEEVTFRLTPAELLKLDALIAEDVRGGRLVPRPMIDVRADMVQPVVRSFRECRIDIYDPGTLADRRDVLVTLRQQKEIDPAEKASRWVRRQLGMP